MSQNWEIRGNIFVNNAVKQEGVMFCMSYAIMGKKDWRHKNATTTKRWVDAQSHILRNRECNEALSA